MPKRTEKTPADEWQWFTKKRIAALVGITPTQIDRLRDKFGHQHERKRGRRLEFDGPAFIAAYLANREANANGRGAVAEGEGASGGGRRGQDPETEAIKREMARIELETLRGDLIPRRDVRVGFGIAAVHLREGIEILRRTHSEQAAEVMIRQLEQAEKAIFGITDNGRSSKK